MKIFKELGFDSTNEWILYDESFQKFFEWMSENITDENILTENEVLEERALKHDQKYLESDELTPKLEELNKNYPSILEYTDEDVINLKTEVEQKNQICDMYIELASNIEQTKVNINRDLHKLDSTIKSYEYQIEIIYKSCLQKSQQLQELQNINRKLCTNLNDCFTKTHVQPLFTHELPLDQYLLKCDSFMQCFTSFLQGNFKFTSDLETEDQNPVFNHHLEKLQNIKNQIFYYNDKYISSKLDMSAIKYATDCFDLNKIHISNINDLKKGLLELQNENDNLDITCETLLSDLKLYLDQLAQQQIELTLYENTKQKYELAVKRFDNVKSLSNIVSDVISNTEIIWILMQLDSEKIKNSNNEQLKREDNICNKRIDILRQYQILNPNLMSQMFISNVGAILLKEFNIKIHSSPKKCLQEYEKYLSISETAIQNLTSKQKYIQIIDFLNNLNLLEKALNCYVYDGPIKKPILENIQFLKSIFQSKINQEKIEKNLRQLRSEFQKNITFRMNSDKLWRCSQLLWIWFLTEPRKVLTALEEIRKIASNVPPLTGVKMLSGLKRK